MPPIQQALLLKKKFGDLVLDKIPIPNPGPGEIRIKILSSSLNPVDWKIQKHGIFLDEFPAILGSDIAGEVEALGQGVKEFSNGDRVYESSCEATPHYLTYWYTLQIYTRPTLDKFRRVSAICSCSCIQRFQGQCHAVHDVR